MKTKHTPGPWEWYIDNGDYRSLIVMDGGGYEIISPEVQRDVDGVMRIYIDIKFDDACLIAAAPDLLEAAKEGLAECERAKHNAFFKSKEINVAGLLERIALIEAAIAKAEKG